MKLTTKAIWIKSVCYIQIFLMLISTIGLALDVHYCQGKVKSVSFFTDTEKCCAEIKVSDCPEDKPQFKKQPCCKNVAYYLNCDEVLQEETIISQANQFDVAFNARAINIKAYLKVDKSNALLEAKEPPEKDKDFNILYSTFLI